MLTEFPGIPGHVTTLSLQLLQKGTCPTYFFLSFFFIFRGGRGIWKKDKNSKMDICRQEGGSNNSHTMYWIGRAV